MAYEKKNFKDGIVLSAEHLNHMEKGIEDAHNMIGTADISGIGDGTIKGAILALKAMIESGGGSGGDTDVLTIALQNKDWYAESSSWLVDGERFYTTTFNEALTVEQLNGCYIECIIGGENVKFYSPAIEGTSDEAGVSYFVRFEKLNAFDSNMSSWVDYNHLYVSASAEGDTNMVSVNFDGLIETLNAISEHSYSDFQGGTLTFQAPQSGGSGGSGDTGGVSAEAFTVDVYHEGEYGESPKEDIEERGEMTLVSYMLPTKEQAENCYLQGAIGESTCKFSNPTIDESYCGYWIVFTKAEAVYGSGEANDADARLFISDGSSIEEGIYVLYHSFNTYGSAAVGYDGELDSATLYFPEV